ncbi:PAS domain-containing protein [Arcobacter sp. s6]|uniref:PAS domain-containing protein n=1 Tax=Arcobacter sp. s6 TaxID=3230363 RepID=UPI0034A03DC6
MNTENEVVMPKDMIIVSETDEKGNIIFANEDFCKIAGYDISELLGNPHNIVRHEDMPKAAFAELWKTIQNGNVWKGIVKNKAKDGSFYWVRATVYPSQDPSGKSRYISVRIKPTKNEVTNAIKLYSTLS